MTFQQIIIPILSSILLMTFFLATAQEEPTTTVTESITESSTAAPEDDSIYITCDFDLENIESLLQYLPDICAEIYNNRTDNELYDLYLEESQNFAKFYKKLNDYELRDQPEGDKQELSEYPFETKLRNEAYNKIDLAQCILSGNDSVTDYLKCLKEKRLELIELIPSVKEK